VQCSVQLQLQLQFRYSSVSRRLTSSSSSSSSMPGRRSRRLQKQKDSRASALPYRPWCMLLTTDYHCTHRARTELAAARAKATRKHMLTARLSQPTLPRDSMPALHSSPESRASSLSLFRYPTTPSRGCETGRQRAHRIGSSMYPHLSIQHTLAHLSSIQSTRPVTPGHHPVTTVNRSESSSSVTCP
jgi:hypothetical protein